MTATTNMTSGLYRRIYNGFLTGRRLNSVSMEAEAWFWRLQALADDFGNLQGDTEILRSVGAPLRKISPQMVSKWNAELQAARLIVPYQVAGETYLHLDGFEQRQPAGKNGKRIQRHPLVNWAELGESRLIQVNPGVPGESSGVQEILASHTHTHTHTESPLPPKGVVPKPTFDPLAMLMAFPDSPGGRFPLAWGEWIAYRREKGLPRLTERTAGKQMAFLKELGHERAIESIENSVRNSWQGLFPPGGQGGNGAVPARGPARVEAPAGKYESVKVLKGSSTDFGGRDADSQREADHA